ncbi:hypothetical protein [cf. Phormidesmis sp. LEGE 11477]|uniref:hypothetical protein n=1 Tax=cf. Phormidesmis sp. LEGE 11477 TaxID=1828680 RepID=UPI00187E3DFD|nr:hypothetical protein [cf. Phormidesmis sp. LEGE 11477]MBE9059811.1 hypothetical protein [cf. Phormidesmis sp. LEGE 11477]
MFLPSVQGAAASTDSVAHSSTSSVVESPTVSSSAEASSTPPPSDSGSAYGEYETVRHMLFGPLSSIRYTIRLLHQLGYAEPNDWSKPISTGKPNEMMAILTKRIRL